MPDFGTVISNAARSDNINQSGLRLDMEEFTALLDPDSWIFLALTRQFGAEIKAKRMKHEFRERRLIPNYSTCSSAASAGDSSISVKDFSRCHNDHLIYVPVNDELYLIQDTSIDETVDVVRAGTGTGTLETAIAQGEKLVLLGEAHAEGEAIPSAYTVKSVNNYDYIQQMDRIIQVTDVEDAIDHYDTRESRAMDRKQGFIEYMRDVNVLMYVGQRSRETTSASGPRRHIMGGCFEKFTENNYDLGATGAGFTRETLANIMGATKYKGASSEKKMFLGGTNAWRAISSWPVDALRISPNAKKWGVRVHQIMTGFGDMDVAYDPVLAEDKGLADRGVVIDTQWVRRIVLQKLPIRVLQNISNKTDIHNIKDAITGTFAMQAKFNELHAQLQGVS